MLMEKLQMNEALTDWAVGEMSQLYPYFNDLDEDKNHDYRILIVNRQAITSVWVHRY